MFGNVEMLVESIAGWKTFVAETTGELGFRFGRPCKRWSSISCLCGRLDRGCDVGETTKDTRDF